MNKYLLIAIIVSTIAECCLGYFGHLENNEDVKKIKAKLCDVNTRPTADELSGFLKCNARNETASTPTPGHEKFREKMKEIYTSCVAVSDDVNAILGTDEQVKRFIYKMCSEKFRNCMKEKKKQWMEQNENAEQKPGDDQNGGHPRFNKDTMKQRFEQQINCTKAAFGIA